MAFVYTDLVQMATGDGHNLWYYSTTDTDTVVCTVDYFLKAIGVINKWDVIMIVTATGGTVVAGHVYCNENTGTVIDVTDVTAMTATDSE